jgi:hypothetical protein
MITDGSLAMAPATSLVTVTRIVYAREAQIVSERENGLRKGITHPEAVEGLRTPSRGL